MDINFFDDSCGFCMEINGNDTENNLLKKLITPNTGLNSRIIAESEHFIVMPTIGAFVEGYVMIVSKEHYECIAKMPEQYIYEIEQLIDRIRKYIQKTYIMDAICFEHGSISCRNQAGGCITHAHLHIVPCDVLMIEKVKAYGLNAKTISSFTSLQIYGKKDISYLYFEDINREKYIIEEKVIISQFFRQLMACHVGLSSQWDWRQHFFLDKLKKTIEQMKSLKDFF